MSTSVLTTSLAQVRAVVHAAQVAVVCAGAVTWTGTAADAAEVRRCELLASVRACLDALDDAERLLAVARRAEQLCVAGRAPAGVRG